MSEQNSQPSTDSTGKNADRDDGIGKAVIRGTVTAIVCAILGGTLIAMGEGPASLGVTMFLFLPAVTGFATALSARFWKAVAISLCIAMALCLTGLVFTGLEGIGCVVMALPILLAGALVGAGIGTLVKQSFPNDRTYSLAITPILAGLSVLGVGKLENWLAPPFRTETFETSIVVEAPPAEVWNALIEFDEVRGPQPLLMRMGLPIPQSCTMKGSGVDAERVCQFNSGSIRERVTRWDVSHQLDLEITAVELPGRHWLGFERAAYTLETLDTGETRVTRSTTVTSTLRPAFYWRFFERLGTSTEHDYILQSLKSTISARRVSQLP